MKSSERYLKFAWILYVNQDYIIWNVLDVSMGIPQHGNFIAANMINPGW